MNVLKVTLRRIRLPILSLILVSGISSASFAQGKGFGFGVVIGDPLGATIKIWTSPVNAFTADIGADGFGSPRLDGDYLWHFDVFRSNIVKMYAGPGLSIGFGRGHYIIIHKHEEDFYYTTEDSRVGVGARVMFGLNIIPPRTPIEIFGGLGPLISFTPNAYVDLDVAVGIRFYP